MVFHVITVIEEHQVIEETIVARRSTGVFKAAVKIAEREAESVSRYVDGQKEARDSEKQIAPQHAEQDDFERGCGGPTDSLCSPPMMRQVPITPHTLRESQQKCEITRIKTVGGFGLEEWQMQEVM